MLTAEHLEKYADVLLWGLKTARNGRMARSEIFLIRFGLAALPLAEILYDRLIARGMHPVLRVETTPTMERSFFERGTRTQISFPPPGDKELYTRLNGSIFLHAPESLTHLEHIDPRKIGHFARSRKYLRDILNKREAQGAFSWTLCMLPTRALAHHARMSMKAYGAQLVKACFLDHDQPVGQWQAVFRRAAGIKKWLNAMAVKHFHIESANVDLVVTPGAHRRWIGISGHNIPSFELFMSPDWRGTRGVYYADQPSFRSGNLVKGVRLEFRNGAAVKVEAKSGREFVAKQLAMDPGANKLGEFSLTDKRFSPIDRFMANTLFDENYGGTHGNCHVALGSSYADTFSGDVSRLTAARKHRLGFNDSALHWDLVNTEQKRVTAHLKDGRAVTIYEDGCFLR